MLLVKSRSARLARDGIAGLLWGLEFYSAGLQARGLFRGGHS